MDLLDAILASQKQGMSNYQNSLDSYEHGVKLATEETNQRNINRALSSRNDSDQLIAGGDLVGALRNAQANGDSEYAANLEKHIQDNRTQLGALAQSLTALPQEHRQAALAAANSGLNGLDVDTNSLGNMSDDQLRALANSTLGTNQQIKNNQADRGLGIEQQNADTSRYNADTSRINSGIEQQNADTSRAGLGLRQSELNANIAHMQNQDNQDAFRNSRSTFTDENGDTYVYHDQAAPAVVAIPNSQGVTLADRNNNPGNLVYAGQPGAERSPSGYARFANPQDGVNANLNQLDLDINTHGYNTPTSLVKHWASTSKPAEQEAYIKALSNATGKAPDEKLTSNDIPNILPTMARQEGYSGQLNTHPAYEGAASNNPASFKMLTLGNGQQVPATLIKVGNRGKQTNQQAKAGVNYDMAKAADATLTRDEINGDIPSKHIIANALPEWWAMTGLPGSTERGILNEYDNAQKHFSQEANTLYHPSGGTEFSQKEQDNLVLATPYDTPDVTSQRTAYRRNVMNDLDVRSQPNGVVTARTLEPGFVDPTTYKATDGKIINPESALTAQAPTKLPTITRDDTVALRRAVANRDANALRTLTQKYGIDQIRSSL